VAITLVVIGVGTIVWQLMGSRDTRNNVPNDFFTTDDGQTWFSASANNLAPFDHDGKQAVKAWVYQCGSKKFVGYLERYTPEAHKLLTGADVGPAPAAPAPADGKGKSREAAARARVSLSPGAVMNASVNGKEYKRPGEKEWTKSTDRQKVAQIMMVKCPDGNGTATAVVP
jgi:hypothetical protein